MVERDDRASPLMNIHLPVATNAVLCVSVIVHLPFGANCGEVVLKLF